MTPLQPFPGLSGFEVRIALTAGIMAGVLVAAWLARSLGERVDASENVERAANAALGVGVIAVIVFAASTILELWGVSIFGVLGIERPVLLATRGVLTVGVLLGAYVLAGTLQRVIYEFTEDQGAITRHQTELVYRTTQVSMYALAVVVVLGVWNIDLGGLLVGAGFLGIVVGLAARQTLGSLIAGFVLMFSRPFEIGDWVKIGDREGIVTEISIVNTRIQTFDGEYAMVPNDVVSSNEIINRTRKGRLRIHVEVGVDYETDLDRAMEVATGAMRDVDEILAVPQPQVVLREFGGSSIVLGLRFWIDKPSARRRWRARTAVIRAVKEAFDREGIKIPFPQRELMGRAEEGGFRLAEAAPELDATPDGGE